MSWDAIIIGSGFGGAMAAHALVTAGMRVLMLERGGWVARGPDNWNERSVGLMTPHFSKESPYDVTSGGRRYEAGAWNCVGGQSVFYGGASYRFRESDFQPDAEVVGESGAEWPFTYDEIEPYYGYAEQLLGVSGEAGVDPTEPRRSTPFPQPPATLSRQAQNIADAVRRRGLTPSRIPLAISYLPDAGGRACVRCGTCDGFACAAEAKNDLATGILPALIRRGMTLRANTVCTRLVRVGSRITAVEYVDRVTGQRGRLHADRVLLAAGALATPHLLLASALAHVNPAEQAVGRYLTRHRNAAVFGVYARRPNPELVFDKQIAIFDLYDHAGSLQQITPPRGLVRAYLPAPLRAAGAMLVTHSAGLIAIAEDEPRLDNGVSVERTKTDRHGLPRLLVRHDYTPRDERAVRTLVREAKRVLREAGAMLTWVHRIETFSHAHGRGPPSLPARRPRTLSRHRQLVCGRRKCSATRRRRESELDDCRECVAHRRAHRARECHPERSEGSAAITPRQQIPRRCCAPPNDKCHRLTTLKMMQMEPLVVAAAVGLLSGTHTAIWGMFKDSIHEGFTWPRFARSAMVGAAVAVAIQWSLSLELPSAPALVVLFGLAYAAERGVIETWKTFVRDEDQSKYFIPMQFSLGGVPVQSRFARLAAGAAYMALLMLGLFALARLDANAAGSQPGVVAAVGFAVGLVIAIGGGWKDAPKEGFDPVKFMRSPAMTMAYALLLSRVTPSYLEAAVAAIGFERATVETYKTFFFPSRPRGKFAGKPISHPEMLARRWRLVPAYVAIWIAVLAAGAVALGVPSTTSAATTTAGGAP